MASKKGKEPAKKVFVGLEAVLDELDRLSDTDSDASYDSVREAAFLEGEDPDVDNLSSSDEDWLPHKRARQPSPSGLHTPCTPGPSPSPTTSAATPTTPTSGVMDNPVFTSCCRSIVGCQACVQQWMANSTQCPKCRSEPFVVTEVAGLSTALETIKSVADSQQ
ncbi:hypothetical protein Q8A67_006399 [Cirrhinus molitorella]|uniref:Uncharacterized protein n=1 Tax=Cirrhinus molitorella TaxID=172907 RepID=A0AA88Q959_9TELE|nr:hypothetical protein Q8A67_006399 [Cirrhinus molitorella]